MRRPLPGVLLLVALATLTSTALAEEAPGPLHLSLEGGIFSFARETAEDVPGGDDDVNQIRVGYPLDLGARVGYRALDFLEVGVAFAFNYLSNDDGGLAAANYTLGGHRIGAYARYVAPGDRFRLFVGPKLGGEFAKQALPGEDGDDDASVKARAFVVGFDVGVYGFVTDSLSIDPVFGFAYRTGSVEVDNGFFSSDVDVSGIQLTIGLALSGWI